MAYDVTIRTPEEERAFQEKSERLAKEMESLDYKEGEPRPDTTLTDEDMASVIMGGGGRRR